MKLAGVTLDSPWNASWYPWSPQKGAVRSLSCAIACTEQCSSQLSIMVRLTITLVAIVLALAVASRPAAAQDPGLVNSAKQRNVVDVQFFADPNFQQINTPFAYYDFPPIQAGSCSACEDFPVSIGLAQFGLHAKAQQIQ